jgi:hypothetical protein
MSNFEFVFSLFTLLLGLALAELLSGFGTAFQSRRKVRVGWLTPLLGLFVALDVTSFWTLSWSVRDQIPPSYFAMMCGLIMNGLYYLVAHTVFPKDHDDWPDYDAYYFAHRRWVLGGVATCNLLAYAGQVAVGYDPFTVPLYNWGSALFFASILALMVVRSQRANIALLVLLTVMYPVISAIAIATGVN